MAKTRIEWATDVWNPIAGCSIVSAGCKNCYAMRIAKRLEAMGQAKYAGLTHEVNGHTVWTGKTNLDHGALIAPPSWKKPDRRVFVNSMSDLFHESVPESFIHLVFNVMRVWDKTTFMVLTKRPERMLDVVRSLSWRSAMPGEWGWHAYRGEPGSRVLPNVWLGVSVEDQRAADERIPLLLQTPAAVRFLSCEPLLGPVELARWFTEVEYNNHYRGGSPIHWVIAGGESGPGARPMHPDWARSLRDQCVSADVPFFFKQWGSYRPTVVTPTGPEIWPGQVLVKRKGLTIRPEVRSKLKDLTCADDGDVSMHPMDKRLAGRDLDGRTWDEFPEGQKA